MELRTVKVRATVLLLLFAFVVSSVRADDLRQRALTNPLDCALYLKERDQDGGSTEQLASAFFDAKRYDDTIRAIGLDSNLALRWVTHLAEKLLDASDRTNAEKFIAAALRALDPDDWSSSYGGRDLLKILVRTGHDREITGILAQRDDGDDKADLYLTLAGAYSLAGNREKTRTFIDLFDQAGNSTDRIAPYFVAEAYERVNDRDAALKVLKRYEAETAMNPDLGLRDEALMLLVERYFRLGEDAKAWELWRQVSNIGDNKTLLTLVQTLVATGRVEAAKSYLPQLETDSAFVARNGFEIAQAYLKMGDLGSASRVAVEMSDDDDDYNQQRIFMLLADRYYSAGDRDGALKFVDLAFRKARRVGETHQPEDSVGASSLTRKIQYLYAISDRYATFGKYDRALAAIHSFKTDHEFGRKFTAMKLVDLAERQAKTSDHHALLKLLDEALRIANEPSLKGYHDEEIAMAVAGAYATLGEQGKALSLMLKVIRTRFVNTESVTDELLAAGAIFEKNHLQADPEMRKLLRQIVESEEE
jgi:tetratricopeptide (TPR) repeat protein